MIPDLGNRDNRTPRNLGPMRRVAECTRLRDAGDSRGEARPVPQYVFEEFAPIVHGRGNAAVAAARRLEHGKTREILGAAVAPEALVGADADMRAVKFSGHVSEFQSECLLA
jgi:hypothetical protein